METAQLILLTIVLLFARIESKKCENGWVRYSNELCFKRFTKLLTYKDAQDFCASQGTRGSVKCSSVTVGEGDDNQEKKRCPLQSLDATRSSLVKVTDSDMQKFLANYTHDSDDNYWLGSKYDNDTNSFRWNDGETIEYTNWHDGYPRNVTSSGDACIEMRPLNDEVSHESRLR